MEFIALPQARHFFLATGTAPFDFLVFCQRDRPGESKLCSYASIKSCDATNAKTATRKEEAEPVEKRYEERDVAN